MLNITSPRSVLPMTNRFSGDKKLVQAEEVLQAACHRWFYEYMIFPLVDAIILRKLWYFGKMLLAEKKKILS